MVFWMCEIRESKGRLVFMRTAETEPRLPVRKPWEIMGDQQVVPDSNEAFKVTNG